MRMDTARRTSLTTLVRVFWLVSLAAVYWPGSVALANGWPDKVTARYKVTFNGFDIGGFEFESIVADRLYTLSAKGRLSALLGLLNWSGETRSAGRLVGEEPRPAGYTFDFVGNSKRGSIKMGFGSDGVSSTSIIPPSHPSQETVPVKDQHLKGVLDPLSAIMAMSRGKLTDPCNRRVSVFDGKERFDLTLSFLREQTVSEALPSGQPSIAYVCRVRYIPIAGHRQNADTEQMAANAGIEVVLRPIPSANLLIPYQVTLQTFAGPAVLKSERVDITTGMKQIALVH